MRVGRAGLAALEGAGYKRKAAFRLVWLALRLLGRRQEEGLSR